MMDISMMKNKLNINEFHKLKIFNDFNITDPFIIYKINEYIFDLRIENKSNKIFYYKDDEYVNYYDKKTHDFVMDYVILDEFKLLISKIKLQNIIIKYYNLEECTFLCSIKELFSIYFAKIIK